MNAWNAADAKRHFGKLISSALQEPQLVEVRGRPTGVVIGYEQFQRSGGLRGQKTVGEWLAELRQLCSAPEVVDLPPRLDRADQFGVDWR